MKTKYTKPMILFESFELSNSICGSCGAGANTGGTGFGVPKFGDPTQCAWDFGDSNPWFNEGVSGCNTQLPEDADGAVYCYHNPDSSSMTLFTS